MCGIAGLAAIRGTLDPAVRAALPAMTSSLRHRGPDGEGFFSDDYAALGHRRLAIIDRAGGAQPLASESERCWIVFNGEIYNHHALRKELTARGHVFRTHSDTEAIVHAYEEYGPACVDRLEGMFAFAIYDRMERELFVARDRLGKKPLFYAALGGVLHFASEIKALRCSPLWDDAVDADGLEHYLSLGYVVAPRTVYRHVRALEPGHWLRVRNGHVEVRQYWDVEVFDTDPRGETDIVGDVESRLRSLVEERLESEVPLGAFLSGGIDSGLVVSFMTELMASNVVTTTVGFGHARHNELDAAALSARHFHTRHNADLIEPRLEDVLDVVVAGFDEPFADASAIPTYYVSQAARRHVTVALSGDGGDEVFGGYDFRYVPHAVESAVRRALPRSARPSLRRLGAHWPRSRRLPRFLRLSTIFDNIGSEPADAYFADLCVVKPRDTRRLLGDRGDGDDRGSAAYDAVTAPYRRCSSSSPVQKAQYADLKTYLPNDVLVKVDRMSMLHGLEVRCPLLDRRLVELAFAIPPRTKMPRLRAKHLLRTIARRRLPPDLLRLPKHGFSAPMGDWIAGPYAGRFADDVFGPASTVSSLIDRSVVRGWFEEHRAGAVDRSQALWSVWMLERWGRAERPRAQAVQVR
jgi:asparagine synthase (glutamine-hydrolysing)